MNTADKQLQEQLSRYGMVIVKDNFVPNSKWLNEQLFRIASLDRVGFRRKVLALKKIVEMCEGGENK